MNRRAVWCLRNYGIRVAWWVFRGRVRGAEPEFLFRLSKRELRPPLGSALLTAGQRREKGRLALDRELKDENENSHPPEHDAQALLHNHLGVMLHRIRNRLRECLEARGIDG